MFNKDLMIDASFLESEYGYQVTVGAKQAESAFKEQYLHVCQMIEAYHYTSPTPDQIEEYIITGHTTTADNVIFCPVLKKDDRIDLFKRAQARQFLYDMTSGRGAALRGEDAKFDACRDTVALLRTLGLYQRTKFTY